MSIIWNLFWMFFKVGMTSFGGGYGMMSMILDEGERLVALTKGEFADMTALDFICSGPIAINAATYVGFLKGGYLGAIVATLAVIIPCIIVCAVVLVFLDRFYNHKIVKGLFTGIKPACGGLLIFTAVILLRTVFFDANNWSEILSVTWEPKMIAAMGLTATAIFADLRFNVNPVLISITGIVFGVVFLA